jgi:hypothetical protein
MCFKRSLEKKGRSCRSVVEILNERCSDVRFHRRFAAKEREFFIILPGHRNKDLPAVLYNRDFESGKPNRAATAI